MELVDLRIGSLTNQRVLLMRLSNRKMNWLMHTQWLNRHNSHHCNHRQILIRHHSYVRHLNHNHHCHIHNLLKTVCQCNIFRLVALYRIVAKDPPAANKFLDTQNTRKPKIRHPSRHQSKGRNIQVDC